MPDQSYQPTLAQLRAFVAIAEFRHFGSAAQSLGISQPTLSQSLAALESGLGVSLVERSTRRVIVTSAGMSLVDKAMAAIDAADSFTAAAAGATDGLGGTLSLGVIPTIAPYLLPTLLPALKMSWPTLATRIVEDQTQRILEMLRAGSIDVALMALPAEGSGVTEIPAYREPFVLVTPADHSLAGHDDVTVSDIAGEPLLLLDEGHCLRDQTLDLCQLGAVAPTLADTRAASLSTLVHCVANGLGITVIPQSAVHTETHRPGLAIAQFADPQPGRQVGVVHRMSSSRGAEYRQFADVVASVMA